VRFFPLVGALISALVLEFKTTLEHKITVLPSLTSKINPGKPHIYLDLDLQGFLAYTKPLQSFPLASQIIHEIGFLFFIFFFSSGFFF
jgi:hypothetical protein